MISHQEQVHEQIPGQSAWGLAGHSMTQVNIN